MTNSYSVLCPVPPSRFQDKASVRGSEGCPGLKTIPFMMANAALSPDGDEFYFGEHSHGDSDEMRFLKNVRYCPDAGSLYTYRIYGEPVSSEDFKSAVEEEVNTNPAIDHVLYNIHGVSVDPAGSFDGGWNFPQDYSDTGYLVIPISWWNLWSGGLLSNAMYDINRNQYAPPAGLQLAAQFDVFRSSVPTSLMVHSMGNWVTRNMAQNIENPELVFDNLWMVAADARMDMFGTDFNPAAPRDTEAKKSTEAAAVYLDIPQRELVENGGYAITKIARHVHVLWNGGDMALSIREGFQLGSNFGNIEHPDRIRKALGKYGDQSEILTTLPYFQERVTYHDFSRAIEATGLEHSYQWNPLAVDLYVEYKQEQEQYEHAYEEGNEDGTGCSLASDCKSGRCDHSSMSVQWVCHPRLELGERCNENNDCISLNCGGWNIFNWQCIAPDQVAK